MNTKTQQMLIGAAMAGLITAQVSSAAPDAKTKCQGGNSCKGQGVGGKNTCKAQGYTLEATQKACDDKVAANSASTGASGSTTPATPPSTNKK